MYKQTITCACGRSFDNFTHSKPKKTNGKKQCEVCELDKKRVVARERNRQKAREKAGLNKE